MVGVSIYLSKENEKYNHCWINTAYSYGFSSIFTSLHIPEDDPGFYKDGLYQLGRQAKQNKMDVTADISPASLKHLGIGIKDAGHLLDWGVTGLRVDYGFSTEEIVQLSKQLKVFLNASTLSEDFLKALVEAGLVVNNTEAAHNFYPRPETGLSKDYLLQINSWLKKHPIKISAFVAGDDTKRQPLYQGLPTLEYHRYLSPASAYLELVHHCLVDDVYIGDPSLREETLLQFSRLKDRIIPLRFIKSKNDFSDVVDYLNQVHSNRQDFAQEVIRLANSRADLRNTMDLKPNHTVDRVKGSITMDNIDYGRYAGEIQITLTDLPEDPKVNVVGRVIEEDIPLLQFIGPGQKISFEEVINDEEEC